MSENLEIAIAVLGLGHVGLPTALGLAELGWKVLGADDDLEKARGISVGKLPFFEPGLEEPLERHLAAGTFQVAADVGSAITEANVLFVCVGTPLDSDGKADLSQVEAVARSIGQHHNGYKLVVEKSTTPVQTAERIEQTIARYASDRAPTIEVAVNPEFLREGTALNDFLNPDRVVLGVDAEKPKRLLTEIYQRLFERTPYEKNRLLIVDRRTAELIKHASNAFLATKISFINMVADLCDATGADISAVAKGLGADPRIGSSFLQAGIGYGGYCLPKDLRAFARIGEANGVDMSLLRSVDRVNDARPEAFVSKIREALWVTHGKTLAVWGLAFKPGTDDIREAPSLKVVAALLREGSNLRLYDPKANEEVSKHFAQTEDGRLVYCDTPEEAAEGAEAILLLTEWPQFKSVDFNNLRKLMAMPIVIDGRNFLDRIALEELGFEYFGMGR